MPRELASRSRWDVPYQNGIRSDLSEPVAPGERLTVEGRVLAPAWPGVYWLQWDMVEEGVAWFAQVSPRQRRTLAIVLPPIAWLAAPIPFLVALLAIMGLRRASAIAPMADAAWCAAALLCKPLIVVRDALLEPTPVAYWLIAVAATVPPILGLLLLPRRVRAWTLVGAGLLGSLVVLGDVVYYRFFGDVLSAPAMLAARQTRHVWGSIRSLLSPELLWLVVDCPLAIWIAIRLSRSARPTPTLAHRAVAAAVAGGAIAALGLAVSAPRTLASIPLEQMFRDRAVVEQLGLFGFHVYDGWNYTRATWFRPPVSDADEQRALALFVERAPMRAGPGSPSFGAARGRNLIVIQVESLQDYVVDFSVAGQDVMPHLKRWASDSVRFTNVTDQTNEGRTSDAELTMMTSLLPLDHGAAAFRFPGNHYTALPQILAEQRYATLSAVAFEPGFWNRQVMHPSYGFQQSLFESDFQMTEQIGWGLNDRDFLKQMIPRLEALPRPFAAWLITLSLHHPFDNFPDAHKTLKLGALERTPLGNYFHTMRFFDDALEAFKTALARDGLLDTSVLVVFGDHDAGFARERTLARAIGVANDDAAWTLNDRIPLFIRVPPASASDGAPAVPAGARTMAAGQTDFAPTMLSLLGIDAAPLPYVGRNLLGAAPTGPVVRPFGDWLDNRHLLFTPGTTRECRDATGRPETLDACAESDREAQRLRDVSRLVVRADLQAKLRARLAAGGTLTQ